ncbi:TraK domain-containing protein [Paraburkholderia dioscoreae]|uniref:Type VI secretion protein n=1 Tax=Paraburkholderia dioscoreae TaxID=2604047 RepID=A0A5Q4YUV7_9BURK|nr:type-F conjugative transfer system secretin TraK [Paraburkholderia dioscoreae]VVD30935.1 Type VI secretion protein [Paraburkholderia dioscoreae]
MMQPTNRYLAALLFASMGLSVSGPARADGAPAAVDFAQPAPATAATQPAVGKRKPTHTAQKKARDPLVVDPSIAVKATAPKEINLPGVLTVPGESLDVIDPTKAQKVSWTNGGSKTVYMSVNEPNRIQLPFKNPYIVQTSDIKVERRPVSNNIYVYWPALPAQPRQLFIEPPGGGPALGLELVPKDIPAQTVLVTDDTGIVSGRQKPKADSSDYISHVQDVMETVARGRAPDGYSQVDVALPPIVMDGLTLTVDSRYSDRDGDIYVYTVRNPGQQRALLREQEFDGANVLAVSIFPKPLLLPGEKTKVIVLARKREEQ